MHGYKVGQVNGWEKSILTSTGETPCMLLLFFILRDVQSASLPRSLIFCSYTHLSPASWALRSLNVMPAHGKKTWGIDMMIQKVF